MVTSQPSSPKLVPVPQWAFKAATRLCVMMIVWIHLFPSSWIAGFWPGYADWVQAFDPWGHFPTPRDITYKYKGRGWVVLLHQLPASVWAATVPFQLSTGPLQLQPGGVRLHRRLGYVTAVSALICAAGVYLMSFNGMTAGLGWVNNLVLALNSWFVYTLVAAVVEARARRYTYHRAWVLRHVASGVWVAVQRILVGIMGLAGLCGLVPTWLGAEEQRRLAMFGTCMWIAPLVCISACELMLWSERSQRQQVVGKAA